MHRKKIIALGAIVGFIVLNVLIMELEGDLTMAYEGFFSTNVTPPIFVPHLGIFVLTLAVPIGIFVSGLSAYWIVWDKDKFLAQACLCVGLIAAEYAFYFWLTLWFLPIPF